MMNEIFYTIGGLLVSVIAYFLKKTMDQLTNVEKQTNENKNQIDLLKIEHKLEIKSLTEKFDELKVAVTDLIKEIKELNKRI